MHRRDKLDITRIGSFGDIFSGTFTFIRQNAREFFKSIILIAGPLMLLGAVTLNFIAPEYFSLAKEINPGPFFDATYLKTAMWSLILLWLFKFICFSLISIITYQFIYLYVNIRDRDVTIRDVLLGLKKNFLPMFGAKWIMLPMIVIPGLCVIFPIFLVIAGLGAVEMLMLDKKESPVQAIRSSFRFTKRGYGEILLMYVLMLITHTLLAYMFRLPASLLEDAQWLVSSGMTDVGNAISRALTALSDVLIYALYILPSVALGLQYYSIKEELYSEGIKARIGSIGTHSSVEDLYAEDEDY